MELWNHCENPYPFGPAEVLDSADSARASLPNRYREQPTDAGIRVVLARRTPPQVESGRTQVDVFCSGDEEARARLEARDWTVIACHDGWYADDRQGGIAVWGGGRHWEVRDTPLHVKEQGD